MSKEINLAICNKLGLHARASAKFVKVCEKFQSKIIVEKDGISSEGDSILGLLMLAACCGSVITVKIEGEDELQAMEAIKKLVEGRFGEEE